MKLVRQNSDYSRSLNRFLLALCFLFILPATALATDDDVPFFAGRTGSPNVMILFDNSDSMQDSAYKKDDGNIYRPSTYWRRGVKINNHCDADTSNDNPADGNIVNGCIADSTPGVPGGSVRYNDYKYLLNEGFVTLPGQSPPNFPGVGASSSAVTNIRNTSTACAAGMECDDRIYDSNVDWSAVNDTNMRATYRYWKVLIRDTTDNSVQYRSLRWYNRSSGYWRVYTPYIEYNPAHTYLYELVPGTPGEVTHEQTSSRYIYDRRVDWAGISSVYDSTQIYFLEVTSGTNAGEKIRLDSYSQQNGYWHTVSPGFSQPCDFTTRYRIIGALNDTKRARGGNHPDSKMFQAKLALKKFLTSDAITTCDATDASGNCTDTRYLMNIGFATFLQARMPRTRAKYYRQRAASSPPYFRYRYRANYSHSATTYMPTGCTNGTPPSSGTFTPWWGITYNNISNNGTIDRPYQTGTCSAQTIRYRVTYTCAPTDSLPDRVRVRTESNRTWTDPSLAGVDPEGNPQWGYTWIGWRYFEDTARTGDCTGYTPPDPLWGDNHLIGLGETCYQPCGYDPPWTETPYYQTTWHDTWGDIRKTNPSTPRYIERNPLPTAEYIVTPERGYCAGGWSSCVNPDPDDISGDGYGEWTLLDHDLTNVPINNSGTLGDISMSIFDYSDFEYPGINNDTSHPHGWSYKKTQRNPSWLTNWRYRMEDNSYLADDHFIYPYYHYYSAIWPDSIQESPYFPSLSTDEFSNYEGDDQVMFVDLPLYDDTLTTKGDDYTGNNVLKVLSRIDLSRHEYPRDTRYVHTMAPISKGSLSVSYRTAQTGNGTPLAATLADARKYMISYMEQDPYTLGGCRKNYIILLTDGTETTGANPVAEAAALQSITINHIARPVKLYVIGFGLGDAEKTVLNQIAAAGAPPDEHGNLATAYFANNVDELVSILAHDIASDILGGSFGRGNVGVTRGGQDSRDGLTLYSGYFDYPIWRGHLKAYDLYTEDIYDSGTGELLHRAGSIKGPASHWSNGCAGTFSDPNDPDAGCIMAENNMSPGTPPDGPLVRRVLYTTRSDGTRIEFSPANIGDLKSLVNPNHDDIDSDGVADTDLDAKMVINFIHHPGFDHADYVGTRDENWPFADIYNSGQVVVPAPYNGDCIDTNNDGVTETWDNMDGYCQFKEAQKNRDGMLYFGTNGGMIEAISTGRPTTTNEDGTVNAEIPGGEERWGYLPGFVLAKLADIKDGHRFTMDLTISAADVDTSIGLDGSGWRTMLVAGQRKGGNHYIALDVTDPNNPLPMWEFSDTNLGQSWSKPSFGRIMINGQKTSVIFFGGGYSAAANEGNRLYILRASDGAILREITVGATNNNVPSALRTMRYLTNNVGTVVDYRTNLAELPDGTTVDYSNRRDFIEVIYFGDTNGTVWRLNNLNSDAGVSWNPQLEILYEPDTAYKRPIYQPPIVFDVKTGNIQGGSMTGCVKRYVLVGTGDESAPIETLTAGGAPLLDYFFEIEDREWNVGENDSTHVPAWNLPQDRNSGKFRLNWRLNLGMQLPMDEYGFLLNQDGSRTQKGGMDILSIYKYIISDTTYTNEGWTIDLNGNLVNPENEIVASAGDFYFENAGNLYADLSLTTPVATAGSYTRVDISLWLTDENGWFYDSADGTPIVDTTSYLYDNNGFWVDGFGNRRVVNGEYISIVTDPGEKILSLPAGYGGYVYFITYTPEGGCATGKSYFYGLKVSKCSLIGGTGVLEYDREGKRIFGAPHRRSGLGAGITTGVTLGGGMAYFTQSPPGTDEPGPSANPVKTGDTVLKYWWQQ